MTDSLHEMMQPLFANMPAMGGRYICPVEDCAWAVDVPMPVTSFKDTPSGGITITAKGADRAHVEAVLGEHFAAHDFKEYLRTIQKLSWRVATLEQRLDSIRGEVEEW